MHRFSPTIRVPLWYYRRVILTNVILILIIFGMGGFLISAQNQKELPPIIAVKVQEPYFPFDITLPENENGEYSTTMH